MEITKELLENILDAYSYEIVFFCRATTYCELYE